MKIKLLVLYIFISLHTFAQIKNNYIVHTNINEFYLIDLNDGEVLTTGYMDSKVLNGIANAEKDILYLSTMKHELIKWDVKNSKTLIKKDFPQFITANRYFEKDSLLYLNSFDDIGSCLYIVNSTNLEIIKKINIYEIPGYSEGMSLSSIQSQNIIILEKSLESYTFVLSTNKIEFQKSYDDFYSMFYETKNEKAFTCSTIFKEFLEGTDIDMQRIDIPYLGDLNVSDWSCSCSDKNFEEHKTLEKVIKIKWKEKELSLPNSLSAMILENGYILSIGNYQYSLYDIKTEKQLWRLDLDF